MLNACFLWPVFSPAHPAARFFIPGIYCMPLPLSLDTPHSHPIRFLPYLHRTSHSEFFVIETVMLAMNLQIMCMGVSLRHIFIFYLTNTGYVANKYPNKYYLLRLTHHPPNNLTPLFYH